MLWADFMTTVFWAFLLWAFLIAVALRGFAKLVGGDNARSIGSELIRRWFFRK